MSVIPVLEKVTKTAPQDLVKVVPDLQKTSTIDSKGEGGPPPLVIATKSTVAPSTMLTEAEVAARELSTLQKEKVIEPVSAEVVPADNLGRYMVMRKGNPDGWEATWVEDMDAYIGKVGTCIRKEASHGYILRFEAPGTETAEFWFHPDLIQLIPESISSFNVTPVFAGVSKDSPPALMQVKEAEPSKVHLLVYGIGHSSLEVELVTTLKERSTFFQSCETDLPSALNRCDGSMDPIREGKIFVKEIPPTVRAKGILAAYELRATFSNGRLNDSNEGVYTWFLVGIPIAGMDNPINLTAIGSLLM